VNTAAIAEESHGLLAFGTTTGTVELWDPRAKGRAGVLLPPTQPGPHEARNEITALEFQRSGLTLGTGSSNGLIHLYDLRSPVPLLKKDQGYGFPIHTLKFLESSSATRAATLEPKIMSADKRIIKLWDPRDGTPWTSVEPAVDINSVAWCKDSGMLLTANEGRQQHSFFIPQLGPAPKWCSFLDNLVEEMAEDPNDPNAFNTSSAGSVYDNYKFLTIPQLRTLNLEHLIGRTNLLRPYMHGYFVAQRLYEEARLITNPYVWEEERAKRVKEKIDKERESRIRGKKKAAVKVNKRLADRLLNAEEKKERRDAKRVLERGGDEEMVDTPAKEEKDKVEKDPKSKGVLADNRFNALFEDMDFAVDEESHEFRLINPSTVPIPAAERKERKERGLTAVEQEAIDDVPGSSSDSDSSSEDERPAKPERSNKISSSDFKRTKRAPPRMQVSSSTRTNSARDRSFGSRAQNMKTKQRPNRNTTVVGEREVSFMPAGRSKNSKPEVKYDKTEFKNKERRSASGNFFRKM
jgi:ribosome biogenesis protein ENP2